MELQEYVDKDLVHSIHTSERRAFRSCRRRWHWAYKDGLYPRVTPRALEFGVAFHAAMEVFYEPSVWGKDPEVQKFLALKRFRDECESQLKNYKKLNGEPSEETRTEYRERLDLGLNMIKYYCENINPVFDTSLTPVEVEVAFEVAVLSPQGEPIWCKCERCWKKWLATESDNICNLHYSYNQYKNEYPDDDEFRNLWWNGLPVSYGGRLDMLAKDDLGRYWIYDWKTTARILDEGKESSFLELDDQIASYCWALKTGYDIDVAGFVYVEIKKAFPQPPEELSRRYKGRLFSTNKQFLTTYEMFRSHVAEHDGGVYASGLYNDHLAWLKAEGPKFHQRYQIHKNAYEITEIGRNIYLEALDMVGSPHVYPTPGRFSCPSCSYRQPCLGMNMGEDYGYALETLFEKREKHYYEVRASTD